MDNFPPIVKNLIFVNALFFLGTEFLFKDQFTFEYFEEYGLKAVFALWPIGTYYFEPYQFFTHMFTHWDFKHILFNMFGLWFFGRRLEYVWGPKRFLFFYFICGVFAAIVHLTVQYIMMKYYGIPGSFAVGASGAVMGVMAGFAYLWPNTEIMLLFPPVPIKTKWLVLAMVAFDLFGGVGKTSTGIAHWAHLGGAAAGVAMVYIWNKTNKKTFY